MGSGIRKRKKEKARARERKEGRGGEVMGGEGREREERAGQGRAGKGREGSELYSLAERQQSSWWARSLEISCLGLSPDFCIQMIICDFGQVI